MLPGTKIIPLNSPAAQGVAARHGVGQLIVQSVAGLSAVTCSQSHSPLKILVPRPRGPSAWAYLSNYGGGLLPGDSIDLSVQVAAKSSCFLGSQSSTKIFRGGAKGPALHRLHAAVGAGGLLVSAPDVAQAFAAASYRQSQRFDLADDSASLVFLDWSSSGRAARGERWAFAEYSSRAEVFIGGRLAFLDSLRLAADDALVSIADRMGRVNCLATLAIFGRALEPDAHQILQSISSSPAPKRADAIVVGGAIHGGAVVRFAGVSVETVAREIFSRIGFVTRCLGDDPFVRKW